jgi:predicted kinase
MRGRESERGDMETNTEGHVSACPTYPTWVVVGTQLFVLGQGQEPDAWQTTGLRAPAPWNALSRTCWTKTVSKARLILTCGLPGSGKTTLAAQLAAERNAVRLTKDEWLWTLGSTPWDEPTRAKVEQQLWRHAQEILRLGLSVVLDFGLWGRNERDEMRDAARALGVGIELHYLDIPTEELWRRIETRNSKPPWDSYPIRRSNLDEWVRLFQAPDAAELALFDPLPLSP